MPFSWKNHHVLVTGASGMVGSWLVKDLLALGAHVVVLIRDADPQSELYRSGDILQTSVVNGVLEDFWTLERVINEQEIQTIFHLGAQTIVGVAQRSPLPTFEANIRGTYNLLEACRLHRDLIQRVVIASSDKAYGEQANLPYTEDMPLNGKHPYEVSKSCADLITQCYWKSYNLPVGIARCGNVFGGGDLNWSRIVPSTIRSFIRGERPVLRSDGGYVRDYIYVKDVVKGYLYLAEQIHQDQVRGEPFNFSNEIPLTVLQIVKIIQSIMQCEHLEPQILNCAECEIPSQHLSAAKAHRILGWKSHYELEQALLETIEWYRAFLAGESDSNEDRMRDISHLLPHVLPRI